MPKMLEHLRGDHARLRDVIRADWSLVPTLLQDGRNNVFEQLVREFALGASEIADSGDEKTGLAHIEKERYRLSLAYANQAIHHPITARAATTRQNSVTTGDRDALGPLSLPSNVGVTVRDRRDVSD